MSIVLHNVPSPGQLCTVRQRRYVVTQVKRQGLAPSAERPAQHVVELQSVDDEGQGERLTVVWELELGRVLFQSDRWPSPKEALERQGAFDDPRKLDAFLSAVRWSAVASADVESLHAPFRSGITIEDYQLDPVARAVLMPRANLLIADDVGLGKTIEAGLVVQELMLRHRARTVLVVCPAGLQVQWRDQMRDRFGLEFRIVDSEAMRELRRRRGLYVNPWTHFPRLITSIDFLKRDRPMRLMRDALPSDGESAFPRRFDLLIVDEAHNIAPPGRGNFAVDSQRTQAIRTLAPHFEHKLFLSATPHNGYSESFQALLELLDDQRFHRSYKPSEAQLGAVMIRRLKRELPPDDLGNARFPARKLEALEVPFTDAERRAHAALERYTKLLAARSEAEGAGAKVACEFVTKLLKKRMFSSPEALRITLAKHRESRLKPRAAGARKRPPPGILRREIDGYEQEAESDEEEELAAQELVDASADALPSLSEEETQVLGELQAFAERASGAPDSKAEALLRFLEETVRPAGVWGDTRVIVFTEYRATQNWLLEQLAARGLTQHERTLTLYGGLDTERREEVKAAFQASPREASVRILLATDAASEGIDLQNHCSRLVHYEIPWNPMRLEQRNGRVDRHGQRASEVRVYHFVGPGWQEAKYVADPGSLEGDLEFLFRAAKKVDQVRDDLGSAGDVIATQVEQAMLGRRKRLDADVVGARGQAARQALKIERDLRAHVEKLRRDLFTSKDELGIRPETIRAVVEVGLELAGHPPLEELELVSEDGAPLTAYRVPLLSGTWAPALEGLRHPHSGAVRPIAFDHDAIRQRDDVVLAHLGHKLVQLCLALLRAEVWAPSTERKLARVTARVVPSGAVSHPILAAHARLVLLAKDGSRLHEELLVVGGAIESGALSPLGRDELAGALRLAARVEPRPPASRVHKSLADLFERHEPVLQRELERARKARVKDLERVLEKRKKREKANVQVVMEELRAELSKKLEQPEPAQLPLFSDREKEQLKRNGEALRLRIAQIPADIAREQAAIEARYEGSEDRVFPVSITYVVPSHLGGAS